jgi:tetratricopeptide (TPR) repeat protein
MTDKQLSFKDDELIKTLNRVYALFKKGEFAKAIVRLEEALKIDYDYPGITAALKCANFWLERKAKLEKEQDRYQRGEYLTGQWTHFTSFAQRIKGVSEKCLYSVKQWVFGSALSCYKELYEQSSACC